jgi:tetratricopeptide (TPR) repeat protein
MTHPSEPGPGSPKRKRTNHAATEQVAQGERSIAVEKVIDGVLVTGDLAHIDQRKIVLYAEEYLRAAQDVPAPPRTHNLPRPPSLVFVGRQKELRLLSQSLSGGVGVITQTIYGLGGVGKSELALQYAHKNLGRYALVWWISAETPGQIHAALEELTARLHPGITQIATTAEAAGWALAWLQAQNGWLLIFDNVEDRGHIEALLAQLGNGHLLVTTRRDVGWAQITKPIRLDILKPPASVKLLVTASGDKEPKAAATLATELGHLPLALEQAAAYIVHTRINIVRYLELLENQPGEMFAKSTEGGDSARTISRIWQITLMAIEERKPLAVYVLRLLAFYAPEKFPRDVLRLLDDPAEVDEALGLLASYSMITLTHEAVSVHRLVQAVVRIEVARSRSADRPDEGHEPLLANIVSEAFNLLDEVVPDNPVTDVSGWSRWRQLLPHLEALLAHLPNDTPDVRFPRLLNATAAFLSSQGQYERSLQLGQRALTVAETILPPNHPELAKYMSDLGGTYDDLGHADKALILRERAMAFAEATLPPYHPYIGAYLGNLASTHTSLGHPDKALPLRERAVAITEATLGPDHQDMADDLSKLAATHIELGHPEEALPLQERAVAITEATLGHSHPHMATRLGNLAIIHSELGHPEEALPLQERAVAITEATLGPDHPDLAVDLSNLATTHDKLGQPDKALPLLERAVAITEATLGPNHPSTAIAINNLAEAHRHLKHPEKALPLQERATAITEATLGPHHPDMAIRLDNLAANHVDLGHLHEAAALQERAVAITEATLGPNHPDMAARLENLAATHTALGHLDRAVSLQERAVAITEATLGPNHPTTPLRLAHFAILNAKLGQDDRARECAARALELARDNLGPEHPTCSALAGLQASLQQSMHDDEAKQSR